MKDIGKRIQEELEKQERSVSWFARQLSCDRSNVYRIFQRNNIDTQTLARICRILQYNFFQELANDFTNENNLTQTNQLSC
ncbi:MAG: helix-turn-helix domain-containing protein [Bacteroidaceae bacterium]